MFFGELRRYLAESFGWPNANRHWNVCPVPHRLSKLLTNIGQRARWLPRKREKGLIHRIDLHLWRKVAQRVHHPAAPIPIQGKVGRKHPNPVPLNQVPDFMHRLTHTNPKRFGGMSVSEARRLRELERENARLKKLLGERSLELDLLQEALKKI